MGALEVGWPSKSRRSFPSRMGKSQAAITPASPCRGEAVGESDPNVKRKEKIRVEEEWKTLFILLRGPLVSGLGRRTRSRPCVEVGIRGRRAFMAALGAGMGVWDLVARLG
jgi:hypothetical protein